MKLFFVDFNSYMNLFFKINLKIQVFSSLNDVDLIQIIKLLSII
jgi:hypothetical protein